MRTRRGFLRLAVAFGVFASACGVANPPSTPPRVYRVGFLFGGAAPPEGASPTAIGLYRDALRDLGYVEGHNLSIEARYTAGQSELISVLAAELVALKVDVIVAAGLREALALKEATTAIPIILQTIGDPVENGLVSSLARPGANITGTTSAGAEASQRRVQLLMETVPGASRIAHLFDASNAQQVRLYQAARGAAAALGVDLRAIEVRAAGDFQAAFARVPRGELGALSIGSGGLVVSQRSAIVGFLDANRLPAIAGDREFAEAGALMTYGDLADRAIPRTARYVDRILKGASPADLPIEKPLKFDFIINLTAARALGITVPKSVLDQATEFIQ
jgi:putative ABC transport system substrate-binding protein